MDKKPRPLWTVALVLIVSLSLAGPAQASDDDDGARISTVILASGRVWGGQHVCLNDDFPVNCPADATRYGFSGAGWLADLTRIPGANWIWVRGVTGETSGADLARGFFSKRVLLGETPVSGRICLAADDFAELRVNGSLVGSVGSTVDPAESSASQSALTCFDVASFLRPGPNVITVRGQNGPSTFAGCTSPCTYMENPAGVVFGGKLVYLDDDDEDDGD